MIFLYSKLDLQLKGEGLGSIQEFVEEPTVTWNESGYLELEFTYFLYGDLTEYMVRDAKIKSRIHPNDDTYLSFTIYEVEPDYIENTIHVQAELSLLHDLKDRVVPSGMLRGTAGQMIRDVKLKMDRDLPFVIADTSNRTVTIEYENTSAYELIFGEEGILKSTGAEVKFTEQGIRVSDTVGTIHRDELRETDYVDSLTVNEIQDDDFVTRIIPFTTVMIDNPISEESRYNRETTETLTYGTPVVSPNVTNKSYKIRTKFVEYRNEPTEIPKYFQYHTDRGLETLEMNNYIYESVNDLNNDAKDFFTMNKGIDEPKITVNIETLGLTKDRYNYLRSLNQYDIVTILVEPKKYLTEQYRTYVAQVNEIVYEPLTDNIASISFSTEKLTLRDAFRNVNEGKVSEQALQAEYDRQRLRDLERTMRNYVYNFEGKRLEFGNLLPPPDEYFEGDMYFLETGEGMIIYVIENGAWVVKVGLDIKTILQDEFDRLDQRYDETNLALDENIAKTDTLFNEWEELKDNLDFAQQEMFINIIGDDGRWVYSDNRLYIEGTPSNEITSNEYILKLEDENVEFTHNGNGFNLGEDYLLSWIVERVERPSTDIYIMLSPPPMHEVTIKLKPSHPQYPSHEKMTTTTYTNFPKVYHDDYELSTESAWYKDSLREITVDNSPATIAYIEYKDGSLTVNHNDAEILVDGESVNESVVLNIGQEVITLPYKETPYTITARRKFYHAQTNTVSINPSTPNPVIEFNLIRKTGVWNSHSWTEPELFTEQVIDDINVRPENSFIETVGVNGVRTHSEEREFIDGEWTGEWRNRASSVTTQPITQVYINGTAVITWRNAQRTEVIPYTSSTYETDLYYEDETVVTTVGVNGVRTFTWQNEYMNDVATGNERNHADSITTAPINERIAIGTRPRTADVTVSSIPVSGRQIATISMNPINAVVPDLEKIVYITVNGIQYTVEVRTNFQGDYLYFLDPLISNGTYTLVITYYLD